MGLLGSIFTNLPGLGGYSQVREEKSGAAETTCLVGKEVIPIPKKMVKIVLAVSQLSNCTVISTIGSIAHVAVPKEGLIHFAKAHMICNYVPPLFSPKPQLKTFQNRAIAEIINAPVEQKNLQVFSLLFDHGIYELGEYCQKADEISRNLVKILSSIFHLNSFFTSEKNHALNATRMLLIIGFGAKKFPLQQLKQAGVSKQFLTLVQKLPSLSDEAAISQESQESLYVKVSNQTGLLNTLLVLYNIYFLQYLACMTQNGSRSQFTKGSQSQLATRVKEVPLPSLYYLQKVHYMFGVEIPHSSKIALIRKINQFISSKEESSLQLPEAIPERVEDSYTNQSNWKVIGVMKFLTENIEEFERAISPGEREVFDHLLLALSKNLDTPNSGIEDWFHIADRLLVLAHEKVCALQPMPGIPRGRIVANPDGTLTSTKEVIENQSDAFAPSQSPSIDRKDPFGSTIFKKSHYSKRVPAVITHTLQMMEIHSQISHQKKEIENKQRAIQELTKMKKEASLFDMNKIYTIQGEIARYTSNIARAKTVIGRLQEKKQRKTLNFSV